MNSRGPARPPWDPREALSGGPLISITGPFIYSPLWPAHCSRVFPPPFIVAAPRGLKLAPPTMASRWATGPTLLTPPASFLFEISRATARMRSRFAALCGSSLDPDRPIVFSSTVWLKSYPKRYAMPPSLCATDVKRADDINPSDSESLTRDYKGD